MIFFTIPILSFFKKYYYLYNKKKSLKRFLKQENNHLYLYSLFHSFIAGFGQNHTLYTADYDWLPSQPTSKAWLGCFKRHPSIPSDMQVPKSQGQPRVRKGLPLTDLVASSCRPSWMRLDSYARLFLCQKKSENMLGL